MAAPRPAALLWPLLLLLCLWPPVLPTLLRPLGQLDGWLDSPLWWLTLVHLGFVVGATVLVVLLALPLAILVTRPRFAALRELTEGLVGLGQTVPTFALLALAVPVLGFGWAPTMLGLVLYGMVPVLGNAIAGLRQVDPALLDAARGMGMTPLQRLWRVEWPLAQPVILAGVRTSMVYNVGTATIGAALGAGGLGEPIINGLSQQNTALVLAGALLATLLALSLSALLGDRQA